MRNLQADRIAQNENPRVLEPTLCQEATPQGYEEALRKSRRRKEGDEQIARSAKNLRVRACYPWHAIPSRALLLACHHRLKAEYQRRSVLTLNERFKENSRLTPPVFPFFPW